MAGFVNVTEQNIAENISVLLPSNINSDQFALALIAKNSTKNCSSDSVFITVTITDKLNIDSQPQSLKVCETTNNSISVNISGDKGASFQWFKNGQSVPNSNSNILNLGNIALSDAGNYFVKVMGLCESVISDTVKIEVFPKVIITKQPEALAVCESQNAKFSIVASGTGTLHYQWFAGDNKVGLDSNILEINHLGIEKNGVIVKCEISSDCQPNALSNSVVLTVNKNPSVPSIIDQGFCQNSGIHSLNFQKDPNNTVLWFDANQKAINEPQIATDSTLKIQFYLLQKDALQCVSERVSVWVEVSPKVNLTLDVASKYVCDGGIINISTPVNSKLLPENSTGNSFDLYKNGIFVSASTSGNFTVTSGNFEIVGKRLYCQSSQSFSVTGLLSEIKNLPNIQNDLVCRNQPALLTASGFGTNGKYQWWQDSNVNVLLGQLDTLRIALVSDPLNYYCSFKISTDSLVCESARVLAQVLLKPDLNISSAITLPTCFNRLDGSVQISSNSGVSPFIFKLNNQSNSTGFFGNLSKGSFSLNVTDHEGCSKDSTVLINDDKSPKFTIQPQNITRCKGNVANFNFNATDYDVIVWQKKLPTDFDFQDISNSNSLNLHLDNIGSAEYPHQSLFRVKIAKDSCVVLSQNAELFVNSITGSSIQKTICENSDVTFDLDNYQIIGSVLSHQWQYREGTSGSFLDLASQNNITLTLANVQTSQSGYYKDKLVFDNFDGTSCIIGTSTSGVKLNVETAEIPTISQGSTICSGQSFMLTAANCTGVYTWSNQQIGVKIKVSPTVTTTYSVQCQKGSCLRNSVDSVTVTVLLTTSTLPQISVSKTHFCKGDSAIIIAKNCNGNLTWSNGMLGDTIKIVMDSAQVIMPNAQMVLAAILKAIK